MRQLCDRGNRKSEMKVVDELVRERERVGTSEALLGKTLSYSHFPTSASLTHLFLTNAYQTTTK